MKESRRSFLLPPPERPLPAGIAFLRQARFRLREDDRVKIGGALAALSDEQVWWRPNEASNSAGNLLLHLAGNMRQWVVAGVGGEPDRRDRPRELRRVEQNAIGVEEDGLNSQRATSFERPLVG